MKYITLVAVSLAVVSNVYAFPGLNRALESAINRTTAGIETQPETRATRQCANFAGYWKGICTVNGQSPSAELLHVTQSNCDSVSTGSGALYFGDQRISAMHSPSAAWASS